MSNTETSQDKQSATVIPLRDGGEQAAESGGVATDALLRQQVQAFVEDGFAQADLAKQIGVSPTALSLWLHERYEQIRGKNENVTQKAARWIARCRFAQGQRAFVSTPSCERISTALSHAQYQNDMVAVTSAPGVGKTTTVAHYRTHHVCVWSATMSPATSGLIPCLEAICKVLKIDSPGSGAARLSESIISRVSGWRGVIVVDESQHLSMAAVEQLRTIHDETQIGLALLGNEYSYTRFRGGPRAAHYAQIRSRIGLAVQLGKPTDADVAAMLAGWGCLDERCVEPLRQVARLPGAMRNVVKVLRWCVKNHDAVTSDAVLAAVGLIGAGA